MWEYEDYINYKRRDGINKYAAEKVLQNYGMFLEEYGTQLLSIQEALCLPFNALNSHILFKFHPEEDTTVLELIDTDNKVLNKMLIVFTALCLEVRNLQKEGNAKYLNIIVYYGEGLETCNLLEGECQVSLSRVLHVLQDLVGFVKRCSLVLLQLIQQMAAFYSYPWQNSKVISTSDVHLKEVFNHIGELLLLLVTFDDVLNNHTTLKDHFSLYQDTVQTAIRNPTNFSLDINKLKCLDKVLIEIDKKLLKNKIFQNILHLRYEKQVPVTKNTIFAEEMCFNIKAGCNDLEMKYQTNSEVLTDWVKLCITYVLYLHLFGTTDKKLFKHIWELSKKFPCVNLYGNIMWFPDKFLFQHTSYMAKQIVDVKSQEAVLSCRLNYISQTVQALSKKVQMFTYQMFSWVVQIEACLQQELSNFKSEDMKHMCNLLLHGLQLSRKMHSLLNTFTNLHLALGKPMTKSSVLSLCRLVENIKSIEYVYNRHDVTIAKAVQHLVQRLTYQALLIISTVKKSLVQEKHFNEKQVDILSSLYIAEKNLHGPPTKTRMLIIRLALCMANRQKTFREEELDNLYTELSSLEIISNLKDHLQEVTNCDFLYWHRVILPIYFSRLYEAKTDLYRIRYVLHAVQSVVANHDQVLTLKKSLDQEMAGYLSQKIIKQMCEEIETKLRLETHSHLQTERSFLQTINCSSKILSLELMQLGDKYLNIKGHLENYLEHTFYDLTTVALHNWRTYGEMRCLAHHKYNLETVEDTLPSQTLEQGLDVLEIMRNIHVFVSKYFYNLNNQIFVEHSTNNKHLHTINIRHIANSIRTHGTGIMSTTVNFTYQFLRKKLVIFSQFLYDEQIKSRLLKDLNYFRENKTELNSKYPYETADRFNKGIRKLGVTSEGLTFLDQFRSLIVHIGNALGYVRMIRSGGLHFCADTISYIPDIDNIIPLEDLCVQETLSSECVDAAKSLDRAIFNMSRNLTEGTEYFKLLVDVFSTVLQDKKNNHLRNFHIIIPPLTINFVEYLIISKEKMSKKSKVGASFTDDGFAMGIAYLLKVLDLNNEFDSLHWFQTVKEKYNLEKTAIIKQSKIESKEDDKLQQTLNLTAKRLHMYQKEFSLLYYSLSSARVLFQRDKTLAEGLIQK